MKQQPKVLDRDAAITDGGFSAPFLNILDHCFASSSVSVDVHYSEMPRSACRKSFTSSDKVTMRFDSLVANPGRLTILAALAVQETQEFVVLRKSTQLTDGNLASHARRLQAGGLISIDKRIDSGKPVTRFQLTANGRNALQEHARQLMAVLKGEPIQVEQPDLPAQIPAPTRFSSADAANDETWVD